ncbi:MAG: thymidine kinase [Nitriliruptoraceae bacterium]
MAKLVFFQGPMGCGKSTLALQKHHTSAQCGRSVLLLTRHERDGANVRSRIGLEQPATQLQPDTDVYELVRSLLLRGAAVDEVILDEAHFVTTDQVDQLARIVDLLEIDVNAFGLLTDFRTELFPSSKRLVELANEIRRLQVEALCWCGEVAIHNARTVDGRIVRDGNQVLVGDLGAGSIGYQVLCRRHHRDGVTQRDADERPDELLLGL